MRRSLRSAPRGCPRASAARRARRARTACPEALWLPPREIYRVEAITKSDDPDLPGWAYFLDLWTETGPARLHIEGELEESRERLTGGGGTRTHPLLTPARRRG